MLDRASLTRLPANIHLPRFDTARLRPGILHLGCGNFHRAHQVVATQAAIAAEGEDGLRWGIASATMRRPELSHQLARQDNLYSLLTREPHGTVVSVMGAIAEALFAGDERADLPSRLADPETRIVTLTVTASGYYLTADGRLNADAGDIRADLRRGTPRTALGILAAGLGRVRAQGGAPPVILSCDNVAHNGGTLAQAVMDFASMGGDERLAGWIAENVRFPDTMVDRIVPATTPQDIEDARHALGGVEDAIPVPAEPWFQWVIGEFDGPRPRWEAHGAQFTNDVATFERAKLQMLNGAHMLLAYIGALAGLPTIAEAATDPALGRIAARFMREEQNAGVAFAPDDITRYADALMERFRNPAIVHQAERIGRNGSAKMAARVLAPMRANIEAGRPTTGATLLIAGWIRWFALHEQDALDLAVADPHAGTLRRICAEARHDHRAQAEAFLAMEDVFGSPLPHHERQVAAIAGMLRRLTDESVPDVLRDIVR
ncbi:D-mannonate oxidoreductase [Neoasaia chiangmaiensis NBRC 101099]|uniref:D-mannonate oxidoreductase n=1 Tax=Neoasaia chiangmaiensis TaxID=320497 RepID=A0A1U9KPP7_9PROT|nr:mannitol dehydrogenase family protein [Neoasaia chiangmaiensis]AQS87786.1 D-mannonate oxidoreductase [Neoasaia chiangmaiensis]GBR41556.1 D-mannonate oxidoreductase [Neoasaia chiangmaiensis NBRC 101099]GEN14392.1 mannitol dehydrogenase [Neoasaia chiangmaiensis]